MVLNLKKYIVTRLKLEVIVLIFLIGMSDKYKVSKHNI